MVRCNDEVEAQRRRWIFYETINKEAGAISTEEKKIQVSYYPGCALHGTAREYDDSTKAVSRILGVELRELPDWNCCGASAAHSTDEVLAHRLAGRNLEIAVKEGKDLVIPCAACYSRLKAAEKKRKRRRPRFPGKSGCSAFWNSWPPRKWRKRSRP